VSRKDEVTFFGYHAVCLIDVLGQKGNLSRWARLPDGGAVTPGLIDALKRTVGTVLTFRDMFIDFFKALGQCRMPGEYAALSADQKEVYHRFKDCDVRVERFADAFVFSSQIGNAYGDASTNPFYRILGACCWAMLVSLAAKTPVRGAVTIGAGAVLEDGSFYGPALAEAHHLESEVADYPRIVVSDDVAMFLTDQGPYSDEPRISGLMRQMADASCSLVARDSDGLHIVDYLGRGAHDLYGGRDGVERAVPMACDFIRAETERFRTEGNSKLADRYAKVQQYFKPRLGLWV
jgi:hypothetical protein